MSDLSTNQRELVARCQYGLLGCALKQWTKDRLGTMRKVMAVAAIAAAEGGQNELDYTLRLDIKGVPLKQSYFLSRVASMSMPHAVRVQTRAKQITKTKKGNRNERPELQRGDERTN